MARLVVARGWLGRLWRSTNGESTCSNSINNTSAKQHRNRAANRRDFNSVQIGSEKAASKLSETLVLAHA